MTNKIKIYLVYIFFVLSGLYGGHDFATTILEPNEPIPKKIFIGILTGTFLFGLIGSLIINSTYNIFKPKYIDIKYPSHIGIAFFGLFGISGLSSKIIFNVQQLNFQLSFVFIMVSIGLFIGTIPKYLKSE